MALSKAGLVDVIAITGETALAETPADTDEILINDGGTIKRIDFSHIKSSGLTQSDMWYMTSNITEDVGFITANWTRYTGPGGNIGSALTESSGVFSFPSTGYYKIDYIIGFRNQSSDYALQKFIVNYFTHKIILHIQMQQLLLLMYPELVVLMFMLMAQVVQF